MSSLNEKTETITYLGLLKTRFIEDEKLNTYCLIAKMSTMILNTDFLYYQKQLTLGSEDPIIASYETYIDEFEALIKDGDIKSVIQLIIESYKTEYAQDGYFWASFYKSGTSDYKFEKPQHLTEMDWYSPEEMICRNDLKSIVFYMELESEEHRNANLLKEMELQFKKDQIDLVPTIESSLNGLDYLSESKEDTTIFKISNSPIAEIRITDLQFNLVTNPNYWKAYFL